MTGSLYRNVEILNRTRHADLRLQQSADIRYAAGIRDCPVVVDEYAEAAKTYPIVFSRDETGDLASVVVMGFLETGNLWVDEAGLWRSASYVPAYVRRYPFVAVEADGEFMLGLDMDFQGVGAADGERLFDADGNPARLLQDAHVFLNQFLQGYNHTRRFLGELDRLALLRPFTAEIEVSGRVQHQIANLLCVDAARVDALPDGELLNFVRRGYYSFAQAHLASLTNFRNLSALLSAVNEGSAC